MSITRCFAVFLLVALARQPAPVTTTDQWLYWAMLTLVAIAMALKDAPPKKQDEAA